MEAAYAHETKTEAEYDVHVREAAAEMLLSDVVEVTDEECEIKNDIKYAEDESLEFDEFDNYAAADKPEDETFSEDVEAVSAALQVVLELNDPEPEMVVDSEDDEEEE